MMPVETKTCLGPGIVLICKNTCSSEISQTYLELIKDTMHLLCIFYNTHHMKCSISTMIPAIKFVHHTFLSLEKNFAV